MAAYNLQTWCEQFRAVILNQGITPASSPAITDAEIIRRINDALTMIQKEFGILIEGDSTVAIVSGTIAYELPSNRISTNIRQVQVIQGSGSQGVPWTLQYVTNAQMNEMFNPLDTSNDAGMPRFWTFNPSFNQQIVIRPKPTFSGSLYVLFNPSPTSLWRVYNQRVITATTTRNSTTVTLSAQVPAGSIQEFDEFGVIPSTNLDGTAPWSGSGALNAARPSAPVWYRIAGVGVANPTVLTLSFPYDQLSASGVNFITSQVADLDVAAPAAMRDLPPMYAAVRYAKAMGKMEVANNLLPVLNELMEQCRPPRPPQQIATDMSFLLANDYPWGGVGTWSGAGGVAW